MTSVTLRFGGRIGHNMCAKGLRYQVLSNQTVSGCNERELMLTLFRTMASGRNHFVNKGSNKSGITEEVRDLIRNVKHAENVDEWTKGYGIGDKVEVKAWRPNWNTDIDDDQHFDMTYYPHKDEEATGVWAEKNKEGYKTPTVLLVERVKPMRGEPWYHKEILERLGLGDWTYEGKRVAVPNMSFYTSKLYQIKHMIKITPVTFPQGLPDREEFDPKMAKVTIDGQFLYHPKIREENLKIESGCSPDRLKIKEATYKAEANSHWNSPYNSPLGNSNYSRDTTCFAPEKRDFQSDHTTKEKY